MSELGYVWTFDHYHWHRVASLEDAVEDAKNANRDFQMGMTEVCIQPLVERRVSYFFDTGDLLETISERAYAEVEDSDNWPQVDQVAAVELGVMLRKTLDDWSMRYNITPLVHSDVSSEQWVRIDERRY